MQHKPNPKIRRWVLRIALLLVLVLSVVGLGWCHWVYLQIEHYAGQDQAAQVVPGAPAAALGVFRAAGYDGRPSPVYRARLNHALVLYHRGIAPLIITLGRSEEHTSELSHL